MDRGGRPYGASDLRCRASRERDCAGPPIRGSLAGSTQNLTTPTAETSGGAVLAQPPAGFFLGQGGAPERVQMRTVRQNASLVASSPPRSPRRRDRRSSAP